MGEALTVGLCWGVTAASDQSSDTTAPAADEPQLAGAAIEAGLRAYSGGDTQGALQLFQRSLQLPGTGLKRYRWRFTLGTPLTSFVRIEAVRALWAALVKRAA